MNKTELLENYTAEQLAEMVEKLDIASEMMAEAYRILEKEYKSLKEDFEIYYENILPRATRDAYEQIMGKHFTGIRIVTWDEWNNRGKAEGEKVILPKEYENYIREILSIDTSEIKDDCYRFGIESLQRYLEIEEPKKKYETEKAKQRIANLEKDLKTATEKIADLANENMKLQCERNAYESKAKALEVERMRVRLNEFSDFLPTEPIKIADMLIDNAAGVYENYVEDFAKAYSGQLVIGNPCEDVRRQTFSYLRQIAEHLLVYCNANGEVEE